LSATSYQFTTRSHCCAGRWVLVAGSFLWIIFLCNRFIISERTKGWMEELASLSCVLHMFNEFSDYLLIFILSILFVEDTVGFVAETYAAKEVGRVFCKV
jgi:hypothetical protein